MKSTQPTLLVTRFSAMGDVALLAPVIQMVLHKNPTVTIILVTQPLFFPFFEKNPRLHLVPIDTKSKHKGIWGIYQLFKTINQQYSITHFVDVHDVLRTKVLRSLYFITGKKITVFEKGRKEKKAQINIEEAPTSLKHTSERYAEVFKKIGLEIHTQWSNLIPIKDAAIDHLVHQKKFTIVLAPFAKHIGKIYPPEHTEKIVGALSARTDIQLFLMGGGSNENDLLSTWATTYPNTINCIGQFTIDQELYLLSKAQVVWSMDSANMHLASLVGTPVISFWGTTHPALGFLGIGQSEKNCVQRDDLSCRPCSVFGTNTCHRGDWACLDIDTSLIIKKIENYLV